MNAGRDYEKRIPGAGRRFGEGALGERIASSRRFVQTGEADHSGLFSFWGSFVKTLMKSRDSSFEKR
jgi:hypothetical protein